MWPTSPGSAIQPPCGSGASVAMPSPVPGPSTIFTAGFCGSLAADLHHILAVEMGKGQRQRLEIIEQAEAAAHPRPSGATRG